jgi:hypothetical protein
MEKHLNKSELSVLDIECLNPDIPDRQCADAYKSKGGETQLPLSEPQFSEFENFQNYPENPLILANRGSDN